MYKSNLPDYEQIIIIFCLAMIPVIGAIGRTFRPAYQQFCIAFLTTTTVFKLLFNTLDLTRDLRVCECK